MKTFKLNIADHKGFANPNRNTTNVMLTIEASTSVDALLVGLKNMAVKNSWYRNCVKDISAYIGDTPMNQHCKLELSSLTLPVEKALANQIQEDYGFTIEIIKEKNEK